MTWRKESDIVDNCRRCDATLSDGCLPSPCGKLEGGSQDSGATLCPTCRMLYFREAGKRSGRIRRRWREDRDIGIAHFKKEGMTNKRIAEISECSERTVYYALKRLNI